ncbi:GNAT family N-acetyltransferase [Aliigemmobacter aestuarii]|uniref:GNAT family N-acetyltransferase n=2 Tax=Aliigemmobacter aestuarii TaxID=1445661 RepID=A0A4S3MT46_9RHOB|nr:GNAT family N-acetyltransferase [Gemmobacter aestuarii]
MIVRAAIPADAEAMTGLLNRIIAIGGTTAHQVPKSPETVRKDYIDGPECITAVVAEGAGRVLGWQAIGWWEGDAHIGTFVDPGCQARGIGAGLFARTLIEARAAGIATIHASIRADNVPGLAYYARIGFVDYAFDPDFALKDGRRVGRVSRRFDLR